jgi:PAT family beta-lactamase induction signal transducer AmpG
MAALVMVGVLTTFLTPEPPRPVSAPETQKSVTLQLLYHMREALLYLRQQPHWKNVLGVIVLYKIIDAALMVMTTPFLLDCGFSKIEIANVAKSFGIAAMIGGSVLAGILLIRYQNTRFFIAFTNSPKKELLPKLIRMIFK